MSTFEKSLRGGTSTPRNNKINNRYGPVGTGSRCMDAEELEGVGSPESSSPAAAVSRNTTPRSAGRYGSPFGHMVSQTAFLQTVCAGRRPLASGHAELTAAWLLLTIPPLTYRLPHSASGSATTARVWRCNRQHATRQECPRPAAPAARASPEQGTGRHRRRRHQRGRVGRCVCHDRR